MLLLLLFLKITICSLFTTVSNGLHFIYRDYKDYAYVGFYNFWKPALLVRDVELVKDVLIKQFNNFHDNWITVDYSIDPVMAKNPFVMIGDEWKTVRTQLTPQYTGAKVYDTHN